MENLSEPNLVERKIEFDNNCINHLIETRKWTMFLSIVGFSIIGILIIVIVIALIVLPINSHNNVNPIMSLLPLLLIMIVYFFPIYYMFKFSKYSKKAINNLNKEQLSIALKYQKLLYRFMGIFSIIIISLYLIIGLVTLVTKGLMH